MAKKSDNRVYVELRCSRCGKAIRPRSKNKKNTTDKLEISKYCPKCRSHQTFKEKK